MERGLSKNEILSTLTKSPHGKLDEYLPVGQRAAREEGEFYAHLIAWNRDKGQIRDSKTALPVIGLSVPGVHPEFASNHLAHIAVLGPRGMEAAVRFGRTIKTPGYERKIRDVVERFLRALESNWAKWERVAVQHRSTLKTLYSLIHLKPNAMAEAILFRKHFPKGTVFEAIHNLKNMTPLEAAGTILERRIPFLIAHGALGAKMKEPDVVMALIDQMTPTQLVTNTKMLDKLGVKTVPALRAAFEQALKRTAGSTANVLKATTAAEALGDDNPLADKLRVVQEKQIDKLGGVEGNWLVLGDKSGSMSASIDLSKLVSATLARLAKGEVHLIFFDTAPRHIKATGKTYEELLKDTKHVTAGGGTSIGCGLLKLVEAKAEIDGIAIVSDGEETTAPHFVDAYKAYSQATGKQVPVYLYHTPGGTNNLSGSMSRAGLDLQVFDLRSGKVDGYSLGNVIATMRTNRYSLIDEILATPLLDLDVVLPKREVVSV